jgi:glycosyltransferase involved in cell wall biosynthesis
LKLCLVNPSVSKRSEIYKVATVLSPKHDITILQPSFHKYGVQLAPNIVLQHVPSRFVTFQDSVFVLPSLKEWHAALEGFDLIHLCDYFYMTSVLPFLPKRCPVTLVSNALPGYSFSTGAFPLDQVASLASWAVCPRLLPRYDRVASVMRSLVPDLVAMGVKGERIEVIPAGVDWRPSDRDRTDLRERYGIYPDERVIMTMGRLVRVKRVELVLETAKRLNAKALILGAGPQRPRLEALARKMGVRCIFFGYAPENVKLDCFAIADLFLLTSLSEGLPTTALEAMANGLPVVSSDLPGMHDIIRQDETGILVDGDDYSVDCFRLLNDPSLSATISQKAAKEMRESRSWTEIGRMYDQFFEAAVR